MRKNDIIKAMIDGKAAKCINFDIIVLKRLEERANAEGMTVSKLVNEIIKKAVMDDSEFYTYMSKMHCAMMNHYRTLGGGK